MKPHKKRAKKTMPATRCEHHAVSYCRVSSREQAEGYSLAAQKKLLIDYAKKHGYHIVQFFEDVETAKQSGRTQFQEMVKYFQQHPEVRKVLTEKTDRITRNFRDFIVLEDLDLQVHLVKENEILSKDSKSHAKFIHGIKVLMAKNYIDNLSEEVKKGMKEKCEQGGFPGRAPAGYTHDLQRHTVELDSDKAPMIKQLFEWYATGHYSLTDLREKCLDAGFTTRVSQQRISRSNIEKILKNIFYTGNFDWNGQRYPGNHQPIVSMELYDKVQEAFRRHNQPRGRPGRNIAFRGLMTCGRCGCAISGEIKKGRYVYYHCTGFRGKCGEPTLREEVIRDLLAESVKSIHIPKDIVAWIREALRHHHQDQAAYYEQTIKAFQAKSQKLQTWIDKAYLDKLEGKITEEFWKSKTREWETDQVRIYQEMDAHERAKQGTLLEAEKILELANRAYSLYVQQSPHEQRRLLNVLLSNSTLTNGNLCFT